MFIYEVTFDATISGYPRHFKITLNGNDEKSVIEEAKYRWDLYFNQFFCTTYPDPTNFHAKVKCLWNCIEQVFPDSTD